MQSDIGAVRDEHCLQANFSQKMWAFEKWWGLWVEKAETHGNEYGGTEKISLAGREYTGQE